MKNTRLAAAVAALTLTAGCGFQSIPQSENAVAASWAEVENQYIRRILDEVGGDKRAAARILGISVRTLQRMQASLLRVGGNLSEKQA